MREVRTTACNRDCPDTCAIDVEIETGRAVALRGHKDDPITSGFLCQRTSRFLERQYDSDRFLEPMIRRDGRLQNASWSEALDLIAGRMLEFRRQSGAASILHYRSGGSLGLLKFYADALFARFGPVTVKRGDICSGAAEAAQETDFGVSDSHHIEDLRNSRLIILWGKNPFVSGPHLLPFLKQAKARGAILIGIDPVRTKVESLCDHFLTPAPGTDFWLAMAFARFLLDAGQIDAKLADYCDNVEEYYALCNSRSFEEWLRPTGIGPEAAAAVARLYASTKPACIQVGWGMGRRQNGSQTVRALDALGALASNIGVAGGGVSFYFGRRSAFDFDFAELPPARTLAEARLGAEILEAGEPPIRMIWVTAGNPLSMLPDSNTVAKAFARTEFKVSVETHPTDTTDLADVVLPTRTLLEDEDLLGSYGNHYLRASTPALEAPQGIRHEVDIIRGVAERVGLADLIPRDLRACKRRLLTRLEQRGVRLEDLERGAVLNPFAPEVLFADRKFKTPNGKMQLLTEMAAEPPKTSGDYPFTLLAISAAGGQSSQWIDRLRRESMRIRVHPKALPHLLPGTQVRVLSDLGSVEGVLEHDDRLRRDLVAMPKGGMIRDGRCANQLIAARETDFGGGAVYYDQPVTVIAADGAGS